jgi:hypothetical protein
MPERDYQGLTKIIKACKRLSESVRDYRVCNKLPEPERDYEWLKEIIKACKRLSESARDYQTLQEITKA